MLVADPTNPNGGILSRFPGLSLPSLGITFGAATPDNVYPTTVYTSEYDGFADFPRYPINLPSSLNAVLGMHYAHTSNFTPEQLDSAILLPTQGDTLTTYYMVPSEEMPLTRFLTDLGVAKPIISLIEPNLRVMVNQGYGDPDHGWSTGPANVHTPFGLLPPISPIRVIAALAEGTHQGVDQAHIDMGSPSPVDPSPANPLPVAALPPVWTPNTSATSVAKPQPPMPMHHLAAATAPVSIFETIENLRTASPHIASTLADVAARNAALLVPMAGFGYGLVVSLPSYNLDLVLAGLTVAAAGDPAGLVHAIGDPIAADTGLVAVGAGLAGYLIANTAIDNINDLKVCWPLSGDLAAGVYSDVAQI